MYAYEYAVHAAPDMAGESRSQQTCITAGLLLEFFLFYSVMVVPAFFGSWQVQVQLIGAYFAQLLLFEWIISCSLRAPASKGCFSIFVLLKCITGCLWKAMLLAVAFVGVFSYRESDELARFQMALAVLVMLFNVGV